MRDLKLIFSTLALSLIALMGCEPTKPGERCTAGGLCGEGLTCVQDFCQAICRSSAECELGEMCVNQACVVDMKEEVETPAGCPVGAEDCECFDNGTCSFGFACGSDWTCVAADGQVGQPCFANMTCNNGLECRTFDGVEACMSVAEGELGEACVGSIAWLSSLPECWAADHSCDLATQTCLGDEGASCASNNQCGGSLICTNGECQNATACTNRSSDCGPDRFCCGENMTKYANLNMCGTASRGMCFDAPDSIFAKTCTADQECNPVDPQSPHNGESICRQRGGTGPAYCSVPCDANATDPGCPSTWSCESLFPGCLVDDDCGAGLFCVGANNSPSAPRAGKCQCGRDNRVFKPCSDPTTQGQLANSTCTADPTGNGDMFCQRGSECLPPSPAP